MSGDRSWMYKRYVNGQIQVAFKEGVENFVQFALSHPEVVSGGQIKCPCNMTSCQNQRYRDVDTVMDHLGRKGFVPKYFVWDHHGEKNPVHESSSSQHVASSERIHVGINQMVND